MEVDYLDEKMGLNIKHAEKQKIRQMLVIGDKELEYQSLAIGRQSWRMEYPRD